MERQYVPHTVRPSISLTSLTQTSPLPFLPFPIPPAPIDEGVLSGPPKAAGDSAPPADVQEHVRKLLEAATTTYSCVPASQSAVHAELGSQHIT